MIFVCAIHMYRVWLINCVSREQEDFDLIFPITEAPRIYSTFRDIFVHATRPE